MTLLIYILISQIVTNVSFSIFRIFKFLFELLIHDTILVNVANYNVNFLNQLKCIKNKMNKIKKYNFKEEFD